MLIAQYLGECGFDVCRLVTDAFDAFAAVGDLCDELGDGASCIGFEFRQLLLDAGEGAAQVQREIYRLIPAWALLRSARWLR